MRKKFDLTGLGYCCLDHLCLLPRIPLDDKTEIIESLIQGGGPAATAVCAAARLGAKTAFIGAVGDDGRGAQILDGLRREGTDSSGVVIRSGAESAAAFCWTEQPTGKRSIAWTRGKAKAPQPDEIDMGIIENSRFLHLDGHLTEAAIFAAEKARGIGVTVSLDAGTVLPGIERLLELSDIVIASEKFTEKFLGEKDPVRASEKLFGKNTKFAGVTAGSQGSFGFDGKHSYSVPAFKVDVVDTTGAGDVFHGAFVFRRSKGADWPDCMRFASAVSALKCGKFGGRTGIPSEKETEQFLSAKS
jgi:ribokinase